MAKITDKQKVETPWLVWSGGRYPEDTVGDVIAAYADGTIMLDDSLTIWNPLRALAFVAAGGVLQGTIKSEKKHRVTDAFEFVRQMKEEWSYKDWEDFYEGIKGAMEKISERHVVPNPKRNG